MKTIIPFFCVLFVMGYVQKSFAQKDKPYKDWVENKDNFRLSRESKTTPDKESIYSVQAAKDITYTLPVVVHVITTGDAVGSPDNPTTANIKAMLKTLNNAFAKKGTEYGGVKMNIKFKLAVRSPSNTATKGINRVKGKSVPNYVSGGITNINTPGSADEVAVKNLSRWPNTDYINIWIVNKINGNSTMPGGYTYFPEHNSALTDGLVLQASVVDGTNKTIIHEMGHYFSLYHIFYDGAFETTCAANNNCNEDGDKICDTEPTLNVACSTATNSCNNNKPYKIADAGKNYTVLNNFMGYTNCQWMFTKDQKTRARSALLNFRGGLITSKALTAPDGILPVTACTPAAANGLSPYYGIERVQFNALNVYSNTSKGDNNFYIDRTANQSTTVTQGSSYLMTITGSYGNPHRIAAFIDYNNDGDFNDANETLFSVYTDTARQNLTIPLSGAVTGVPLRMRIVADNPALPAPTACNLHGTSADGVGQAEDYAVIVMPFAVANYKQTSTDPQRQVIIVSK
ncbi:MAG TPA: M43 family zinc metalloprotease [Parafilimonas sp.]|nr:M43 family zinc metalloprotease [Parafilimonas sp.]